MEKRASTQQMTTKKEQEDNLLLYLSRDTLFIAYIQGKYLLVTPLGLVSVP